MGTRVCVCVCEIVLCEFLCEANGRTNRPVRIVESGHLYPNRLKWTCCVTRKLKLIKRSQHPSTQSCTDVDARIRIHELLLACSLVLT